MPGERGGAGTPGPKGEKVSSRNLPPANKMGVKEGVLFLCCCASYTLFPSPKGEPGHKGPDGNPGRDGPRVSKTLPSLLVCLM